MIVDYGQIFSALLPETIIVITAFIALSIDLIFLREAPHRIRVRSGVLVVALGCFAAIGVLAQAVSPLRLLEGMLALDDTALFIKQIILVLTIVTAIISLESNFTKHVGE